MESNIQLIQDFYTALAKGNFIYIDKLFADNVKWNQPGKSKVSGLYEGKTNVFAHLGNLVQLSNMSFTIDSVEFIAENNSFVSVPVTFSATSADSHLKMKGVDLFTVHNNQITEVWLFSENIETEDLFWNSLCQ